MALYHKFNNNTICAPATAQGPLAAIAIVRISGPQSHQIVSQIFRQSHSSSPQFKPSKIYYGHIYDGDRLIDEVLVHLSVAPFSFTGEDTAEINCHGSPYIVHEIIRLVVSEGATIALPGEFSQRAFVNGKIDLAQAEAIADLISSENEAAHRLSIQQMRGGFSQEIQKLRSALVDYASLLELELDFSEEEVAFADRKELLSLINQIIATIERLCASFSLGNVLKNGVPTAIVGATNVGKSTLFNALLNEERSIVSDIHGTTRDTVEEVVTLEGVQFRMIDTAGLRQSNAEIEVMGMERTLQKVRSSSLLLLVLDANHPELFEDQIKQIDSIDAQTRQVIVVLNKSEILYSEEFINSGNIILSNPNCEDVNILLNNHFISKIVHIAKKEGIVLYAITFLSAKNKMGIDSLQTLLLSAINDRYTSFSNNQDVVLVSNLRHFNSLQDALKELVQVRNGIIKNLPTDLVAQDLRHALYHLGSITGDITTDEILGNIFGKFCIGK